MRSCSSVLVKEATQQVTSLSPGWRGLFVQPATLLRRHRDLVRRRWSCPHRRGRAVVEGVGLVHRLLVAIHGAALKQPQLDALAAVGATLVWSPFSNLWLYGQTAAIGQAKASGLRLCLRSDWAPSGTKNVLWKLKVADTWNRAQPQPVFTPRSCAG